MLRSIKTFVLGGLVTFAALLAASYTHHVIRLEGQTIVVRRTVNGFEDIFVDVRDWNVIEFARHPDVSRSLVIAGVEQASDRARSAYDRAAEQVDRSLQDLNSEITRSRDSIKAAFSSQP